MLVALLNLSSWCHVMVEWLFLVVPLGCLWLVIVVFPDHTHLLIKKKITQSSSSLKARAVHYLAYFGFMQCIFSETHCDNNDLLLLKL